MASSTVRVSSRRSSEPFSLVAVDGYCHCFFCDLLPEFDKKGVATPGLKCGPVVLKEFCLEGVGIRNIASCTHCQL